MIVSPSGSYVTLCVDFRLRHLLLGAQSRLLTLSFDLPLPLTPLQSSLFQLHQHRHLSNFQNSSTNGRSSYCFSTIRMIPVSMSRYHHAGGAKRNIVGPGFPRSSLYQSHSPQSIRRKDLETGFTITIDDFDSSGERLFVEYARVR